ncbi:TPA: transporter substrate-binding domain-containing protein [Burkholderia vietnamiensis]|nr:transporter substrate-binding domain-containing protein [Burkholderia vietnamiensis]
MNKLMKFVFAAFFTAAVSVSIFAAPTDARADDGGTWQRVKKAGVLRCGAAISAPYVMRDPATGAYSGVFSDLCRNFGEKVLKVKVEFVDTTWENIVAGLQSDKWDLSLALNDTPERRKAIAFSGSVAPYNVTFVYNKNNPKLPKGMKSISDFDKSGVSVAVMSGSAQDRAITQALKQAQIVRLPGEDEIRLALMSKRADLLADDNTTNMLLTQSHADWAVAFHPNPPLAEQQICFGVSKDLPAADLAVLNSYIDQQVKSGNVEKMLKTSITAFLAQSK